MKKPKYRVYNPRPNEFYPQEYSWPFYGYLTRVVHYRSGSQVERVMYTSLDAAKQYIEDYVEDLETTKVRKRENKRDYPKVFPYP